MTRTGNPFSLCRSRSTTLSTWFWLCSFIFIPLEHFESLYCQREKYPALLLCPSRCLDNGLVYPPENPFLCHYADKLNETFVIRCCKDYDMCNRDLHPSLHVSKEGMFEFGPIFSFYFKWFFFLAKSLFFNNKVEGACILDFFSHELLYFLYTLAINSFSLV